MWILSRAFFDCPAQGLGEACGLGVMTLLVGITERRSVGGNGRVVPGIVREAAEPGGDGGCALVAGGCSGR